MIGVSGVRGIVGETFTPELASRFASAFSTFVKRGKVVVGKDSRLSGEMIKHAVISGLVAGGSDVVDVGICPTPTIQLAVEDAAAGGGIAVTASHNPEQWNALKFIGPSGGFLNDNEGAELLRLYKKGLISYAGYRELGRVSKDGDAISRHVSRILDLQLIDGGKISARRFRVAVDCCNGAGGEAARQLLRALGCQALEISCEPTGLFPRGAEPLKEHLSLLADKVCGERMDAGFAFDPDADRMSIVTEKGNALGEERTICLTTAYVLSKKKGPVSTNVSTTAALDDVVRSLGSKLHRTKVGEAHVVEKMRKTSSVVGGEGNGGVILPALHYARDGMLAMALALQYMADTGKKLSELDSAFPRYHMVKKKVDAQDVSMSSVKEILVNRFNGATISNIDGVRMSWPDKWFHVRKSRTEPIVRVIAESSDAHDAVSLAEEVSALVRSAR
jgi:phosphomannomutase